MAESVFKHKVDKAGLLDKFEIASVGTAGYHIGESPDNRTIATLAGHGIDNYSKAQQLKTADLEYYDLILAMDYANQADILQLSQNNSKAKIELFRNYDTVKGDLIVPDPYYGDMSDFSNVYQIVERCSENLLKSLM